MGSLPALPLFTSGPLRSATLNRIRDLIAILLNPPRCNAYLAADTSIPTSAVTTVGLTAELYDVVQSGDTGMHDNVTNNSRVTVRTAGYYRVVGQVTFAANATGTRAVQVRKNGAVLTENYQAASTGSTSCPATIDVLLSVGDYLELNAYQTSGAGLNALGGSSLTFLQVAFIGASATTSGDEYADLGNVHQSTLLSTEDLDAVTTPGNYLQDASADATLARHYPSTQAGHLEVLKGSTTAFVMQRYTEYDTSPNVWVRTFYTSLGWSTWEMVGDQTAGGSAGGSALAGPPIPLASNAYCTTDPYKTAWTTSNAADSAGASMGYPFTIGQGCTVDSVSVENLTAGAAGSVSRFMLYRAGTDGKPDALVFDSGTEAADVTGVKTFATSLTLTPGTYWAISARESAPVGAALYRAFTTAAMPWHASAAFGTGRVYVLGALNPSNAPPATWTNVTFNGTTARYPILFSLHVTGLV